TTATSQSDKTAASCDQTGQSRTHDGTWYKLAVTYSHRCSARGRNQIVQGPSAAKRRESYVDVSKGTRYESARERCSARACEDRHASEKRRIGSIIRQQAPMYIPC